MEVPSPGCTGGNPDTATDGRTDMCPDGGMEELKYGTADGRGQVPANG